MVPSQAAAVKQEVAVSTETINTSKTELTDLNRLLQSLQIELQSQLSMVSALLSVRVWSGDVATLVN